MALEKVRELGNGTGSVLQAHGLRAGADTDLNHARLDGVGDVDASLKTRRALPVQALNSSGGREAGSKGGSTELGCAAAWSEDSTDGDVFDELGVDAGALNEGFVSAVEEVSCLCVFEATLATLCEGCAKRAGYDDL